MLKASNVSVESALRLFNSAGVAVGLLVPTHTGYGKSIMDATLSFRDFLKSNSVHDYSAQRQGPAHKIKFPANFVFPDRCVRTSASFYRPCTKQGDPRLWFSKLTSYCRPTDLLAVVAYSGELFVFNMSDGKISESFGVPGSYPHEILAQCAEVISPVAKELLERLRTINKAGLICGICPGDTNVGVTLEHLLGIPPNTSKFSDYKGIELKASRQLGRKASSIAKTKKVTLFTNTPDWERSRLSAKEIIEKFGYKDDNGRLQLYCTVSNHINPQGLYLDAGDETDLVNKAKSDAYTGDVAVWALSTLKQRLLDKHNETFWVQASSEICDGKEHFKYDTVRHTRRPNVGNLGALFDAGIITLDYAMHIRPNGSVRDHGYLFRTTSDKFPHIFPLERVYDLSK